MTTKEIIFQKALFLFSQKGYYASSIRNICAEVGIKESSFYNHYISKNHLLEDIFQTANHFFLMNSPSNEQLDLMTTQLSLREMLQSGLDQYINMWDDPNSAQMWFVISMEQYRNPIAGQLVIDEAARRIQRSAYSFSLFQEKGKMKAGDPLILANLYNFSIRSLHLDYGLRKLHNNDSDTAYKAMQDVCDFFCTNWEL